MCIIAIKPKGLPMFDKQTIENMFYSNSDGFGFMYEENGNVIIDKGYFTLNEVINKLNEKDFTNKNVVLHFRISTSGLVDGMNCHPFPIYQKNDTKLSCALGMVHNGVLYDYNPPKDSNINDTQVFINKVLKHLKKGFLNHGNCRKLLAELIGSNKLAFLDDKGNVTRIGEFICDSGYYYSNTSYKYSHVYKPVFTSFYNWNYVGCERYDYNSEDEYQEESEDVVYFNNSYDFYNYIEKMDWIDESFCVDEKGVIYEVDDLSLALYRVDC